MSFLKTIRHTCGISIGATVLAFCVILIAGASGQRAGFALFVAAIVVSAFFEGFPGGLAATGLAVLGLVGPFFVLRHDSPFRSASDLLLSAALLGAIGGLVSFLTGECRHLIRQLSHLRHTLACHSDGIIQTDAAGNIHFLNESAQGITGWTLAEAVGKPLTDVGTWTSEDDSKPLHLIDRLTQTASSWSGSARLQARGGSETLVEIHAQLHQSDGATPGWLIHLRDVGEQRRNDAALRQRDERLRIVTQNTMAGLLLLDRDGNCIYTNPAARALLALASECTDRSWLDAVHADDRAAAEGWLEACRKGTALTGEWRVLRSTGSDHWVRIRAEVAVSDRGLPFGSIGTLLDITEERATALRAIELKRELDELETYHTERTIALEKSQAALEKQLAETREHEEAQRHGHDQEKRAWEQAVEERRREHERHGEQWRQTEANLRSEIEDRSGKERKARQELEAVQAEMARHRQTWQETESDLKRQRHDVERKLAEQKAASEHALAAMEKERDAWAETEQTLRHEIDNLTAAKQRLEGDVKAATARETDLWTELEEQAAKHQQFEDKLLAEVAAARDSAKTSESILRHVGQHGRRLLAELADSRDDATVRLGKLLRHVYAITQLWDDGKPAALEPVELHETFDRAIALSSISGGNHRVHLTLPLHPIWVMSDPELLAVALVALLDNAVEHTPAGSNIAIEAETTDDTLVLRVRDEGRGLTEDQLEPLAHVSVNARRFHRDAVSGLGLGLAVARGVAERCGGKLTASILPGSGSEFALRLPILAVGSMRKVPVDDGPRLLPFVPETHAILSRSANHG